MFFFSKHSVDKIITQWTIFITRSPQAIFLDNPKFHSQTHVNHESNLGHLNPHFTFQLVRSFTITGKKYLNLRRSGPTISEVCFCGLSGITCKCALFCNCYRAPCGGNASSLSSRPRRVDGDCPNNNII